MFLQQGEKKKNNHLVRHGPSVVGRSPGTEMTAELHCRRQFHNLIVTVTLKLGLAKRKYCQLDEAREHSQISKVLRQSKSVISTRPLAEPG